MLFKGKKSNSSKENSKSQKLETIIHFCNHCDRGRGIWKRIDENRELLDFLKDNNILDEFPFLEVWISKQDEFLVSLGNVLELNPPLHLTYPRVWKGTIEQHYVQYDKNRKLKFFPHEG